MPRSELTRGKTGMTRVHWDYLLLYLHKLLRIFVEFFAYVQFLKFYNFMVFRLLENVFFTLYLKCTQAKLCTRFFPLLLRQMEISHPPHDFFLKMCPPPRPPSWRGEAIQTLLTYTFCVSVKACKNTDRRQPFLNLNWLTFTRFSAPFLKN